MSTTDIINKILQREGGEYTNRPADKGGPTKWGITQKTLSDCLGRTAYIAEVVSLSRDRAFAIYYDMYVTRPGYDKIYNEELRSVVVDCCVQFGEDDATPWLQRAANLFYGKLGGKSMLEVDGKFGPKSANLVNSLTGIEGSSELCVLIMAQRIQKRGDVIASDARRRGREEDQALNAHGWANRDAEILNEIIGVTK